MDGGEFVRAVRVLQGPVIAELVEAEVLVPAPGHLTLVVRHPVNAESPGEELPAPGVVL